MFRLGPATVRFTGRAEGDMAVATNRAAVVDLPWTWLGQEHGAAVVVVDRPGGAAGATADGAVSDRPGCALSVLTADCAPLALASDEGVVGVAHAGWRGLREGVIGAAVDRMHGLGARRIQAALGPCIHAGCYEFGEPELSAMAARFGSAVRSETTGGRPSLDLPAAVAAALDEAGVELACEPGPCTACSAGHYSWRARRERERQATVVWR